MSQEAPSESGGSVAAAKLEFYFRPVKIYDKKHEPSAVELEMDEYLKALDQKTKEERDKFYEAEWATVRFSDGRTILHALVQSPNCPESYFFYYAPEFVPLLGVQSESDGNSALHDYLTRRGNRGTTGIWNAFTRLENNAEKARIVNLRNKAGQTALSFGLSPYCIELFQAGAVADVPSGNALRDGDTCLHVLAKNVFKESCWPEMHLMHGVEALQVPDKNGDTPLHLFARNLRFNHIFVAPYVFRETTPAMWRVRNRWGDTPLDCAARSILPNIAHRCGGASLEPSRISGAAASTKDSATKWLQPHYAVADPWIDAPLANEESGFNNPTGFTSLIPKQFVFDDELFGQTVILMESGAVFVCAYNPTALAGKAALKFKSTSMPVQVPDLCATQVALQTTYLAASHAKRNRECCMAYAISAESGKLLQWGISLAGDRIEKPSLVKSLEAHIIVEIAASGNYCYAISAAHLVFAWGIGDEGQLGLGPQHTRVEQPTLVSELSGRRVQRVACAPRRSVFVDGRGAVWATGLGVFAPRELLAASYRVVEAACSDDLVACITHDRRLVIHKNDGLQTIVCDAAYGPCRTVAVAKSVVAVTTDNGRLFRVFEDTWYEERRADIGGEELMFTRVCGGGSSIVAISHVGHAIGFGSAIPHCLPLCGADHKARLIGGQGTEVLQHTAMGHLLRLKADRMKSTFELADELIHERVVVAAPEVCLTESGRVYALARCPNYDVPNEEQMDSVFHPVPILVTKGLGGKGLARFAGANSSMWIIADTVDGVQRLRSWKQPRYWEPTLATWLVDLKEPRSDNIGYDPYVSTAGAIEIPANAQLRLDTLVACVQEAVALTQSGDVVIWKLNGDDVTLHKVSPTSSPLEYLRFERVKDYYTAQPLKVLGFSQATTRGKAVYNLSDDVSLDEPQAFDFDLTVLAQSSREFVAAANFENTVVTSYYGVVLHDGQPPGMPAIVQMTTAHIKDSNEEPEGLSRDESEHEYRFCLSLVARKDPPLTIALNDVPLHRDAISGECHLATALVLTGYFSACATSYGIEIGSVVSDGPFPALQLLQHVMATLPGLQDIASTAPHGGFGHTVLLFDTAENARRAAKSDIIPRMRWKTHVRRPCITCDRSHSRSWRQWQSDPNLKFPRDVVLRQAEFLAANDRHMTLPAFLCADCEMTLCLKWGFVSEQDCVEACARDVENIVSQCQRSGTRFTSSTPLDDRLWRKPTRPGLPAHIDYPSAWRRIGDMMEFIPNPAMFVEGLDASDIEQGAIGTCYLLSSLSVMTTRPALVERLVIAHDIEVGVYGLRFFDSHSQTWRYVVIDDWIPVQDRPSASPGLANDARPLYAWSRDRNELYVMIIEKAYAASKGSYEAIDGGIDRYAMAELTGGVCEQLHFMEPKVARSLDTGSFWESLLGYFQQGRLMSCYIEDPSADSEELLPNGLLIGHAYAIEGVKTVGHNRLIRLRNPHGNGGWNGAWSNLREEVIGAEVANDGQFYMSYADFIETFTACDVTTVHNMLSSPDASNTSLDSTSSTSSRLVEQFRRLRPGQAPVVFGLRQASDEATVTINVDQTVDAEALTGVELSLLVCLWREGEDFMPGDGAQLGPVVFGDWRTGIIVDRVYPTSSVRFSLRVNLSKQSNYGYFIVLSAFTSTDVECELCVFENGASVTCQMATTEGWDSPLGKGNSYGGDEDPLYDNDEASESEVGRRGRNLQVMRRGRNLAVMRRGRQQAVMRRNARSIDDRFIVDAGAEPITVVGHGKAAKETTAAAEPSLAWPEQDQMAQLRAMLATQQAQINTLTELLRNDTARNGDHAVALLGELTARHDAERARLLALIENLMGAPSSATPMTSGTSSPTFGAVKHRALPRIDRSGT